MGQCAAGELVESRLRPTAMRAFLIACGLLLAACLAACGDEPPTTRQPPQAEFVAEEQQAEPVRESSATTSTTQPQPQTRTTVIKTNVEEPQTQAQLAEEAEPTKQTEQAQADAVGEDGATDVPESTQEGLTDLPAVVLAEAEVRVRPGLAWPAIDRLGIGESVLVLSRTRSWLRVSYGGANEGWIRSGALGLGKIEERDVLHQPAPPILAEWQGVEFGVMGQSADAAEVRLLGDSNEIVSAPKSEVTLLASDITIDDLPVLIGDETVVFPGDDFRAGQGKILPRAGEWMWLPWGWLLAHNDEYIWQWRPETDELEFVRRARGQAKFSPDGQFVAIAKCTYLESECLEGSDTVIVSLDGAEPISLREAIQREFPELEFLTGFGRAWKLTWTSDSKAVLAPVSAPGPTSDAGGVMRTPASHVQPMALLTTDAEVTLFVDVLVEHVGRNDRYYGQYPWQSWRLRGDNTIGIYVFCRDGEDDADFEVVFDRRGEFLRLEAWGDVQATDDRSQAIRDADARRALGETLQIGWSPTASHAVVISEESKELWLFDSQRQNLTLIAREGENAAVGVEWGRFEWDVHWSDDSFAAVVPRYIVAFARTVIVVDIANGRALTLDIERIDGLPCSFTPTWSPGMNLMQIALQSNDRPEGAAAGLWIDGTSIRHGAIGQHLISSTVGGDVSILRTLSHGSFQSAFHRAEWSPGGEWLAIGGNHEWRSCSLGH